MGFLKDTILDIYPDLFDDIKTYLSQSDLFVGLRDAILKKETKKIHQLFIKVMTYLISRIHNIDVLFNKTTIGLIVANNRNDYIKLQDIDRKYDDDFCIKQIAIKIIQMDELFKTYKKKNSDVLVCVDMDPYIKDPRCYQITYTVDLLWDTNPKNKLVLYHACMGHYMTDEKWQLVKLLWIAKYKEQDAKLCFLYNVPLDLIIEILRYIVGMSWGIFKRQDDKTKIQNK